MKTFFVLATALCLASPAQAGEHGKSCPTSVQGCLNKIVTKLKSTGFIGVELDEALAEKVLIVSKVIAGSPAEAAGIRKGDELYALNGLRFADKNHEKMSKVKVPGNEVTCTIKRDGASREFKLTLVPMPADLMAKYIGEHMMDHARQGDNTLAKK